MSILVNHLTKIYGAQKAVDDISFSINKGEIVGFLGPNGAGKSTTMKIITGYLEADEGNVEVCEKPVTVQSLDTKKKIGYLPEANPLYYEMYVKEYLEFIAGVHSISDKKKAISNVIATVGLTLEANKKIGQLSKGYKQRVGLAAALIHNPEVLILDEPTSGLDPNQIAEIREVIKQLGKEKTILFSTHILQEVEAICDRVIIIHRGKIVADDKLSVLQKSNSEKQLIIVEFKEKIDIEELKFFKDVNHVETLTEHIFQMDVKNPDTVRKQLLELCLKNNVNIVSLQNKSNYSSLEDLFRELTIKKEHSIIN